MRRARSDRHTVLTSGPFWAVPYASPAPATTPILERPPRQTACVVTSPKAQMVVIPVSSLAIGRGGQVPRSLALALTLVLTLILTLTRPRRAPTTWHSSC